jgi:DNA polymerase sigma
MTSSALLEHVTQTIVERFHPKRIVLFGSHARGNAGSDSDLDLFIEMESSRRPPERAISVPLRSLPSSGYAHGHWILWCTHQKKFSD